MGNRGRNKGEDGEGKGGNTRTSATSNFLGPDLLCRLLRKHVVRFVISVMITNGSLRLDFS